MTTELKETSRRLGDMLFGWLLINLIVPSKESMKTISVYNNYYYLIGVVLVYQASADLTIAMIYHVRLFFISVGYSISINAITLRLSSEKNIEVKHSITFFIILEFWYFIKGKSQQRIGM